MNYQGTIIEESLANKDVLAAVKILRTRTEPVSYIHKTPWIKQLTLNTVEIVEEKGDEIAEKISMTIDINHAGSWFVDFKNDKQHYIIFHNKVFKV